MEWHDRNYRIRLAFDRPFPRGGKPSHRARVEAYALTLLWHGADRITVDEVASRVGCARSTARRWLGRMTELLPITERVEGAVPGPRHRLVFWPRGER